MTTWIALLRGINVGGHHVLPMAELRAMLGERGLDGVRTYIQSGNIVFRSPEGADALATKINAWIYEHAGFSVPVVLRSAEELATIAASNPYASADIDEKHLLVGFLQHMPADGAIARLDPDRSPPDRFTFRGREIYLHFPRGMARTKLTSDWFDRRLGGVTTFRNWRTVHQLIAMATGG